MADFKIGDSVRYFPVMRDRTEFLDTTVHDVFPEGIPSLRVPLLMLEGKSGVIMAAHCEKLLPPSEPGGKA